MFMASDILRLLQLYLVQDDLMEVYDSIDPLFDSLLLDCVSPVPTASRCGGAIGAMDDLMSPSHHHIKISKEVLNRLGVKPKILQEDGDFRCVVVIRSLQIRLNGFFDQIINRFSAVLVQVSQGKLLCAVAASGSL